MPFDYQLKAIECERIQASDVVLSAAEIQFDGPSVVL